MARHSYNFAARSRSAMADAIERIGHERGYHGTRYPFCFNVKLDSGWDSDAAALSKASGGDYELRPEWDSDWESYAEKHSDSLFNRVAESMYESMVENYSTYPGDDSGEWEFEIAGRCGGWLCLVGGPGFNFRNCYLDDIVSEVRGDDADEQFTWDECKRLYRALVCMERDFRREAITQETRYQLAFIRAQWEEDREGEIRESWRSYASSRDRATQLWRELRPVVGTIPAMVESESRARIRELARQARAERAHAVCLLGDVPLAAIAATAESV